MHAIRPQTGARALPGRRAPFRAVLIGGALLALAALAPGCATPLFPRDQPRSQYESYDTVRNQAAPRYRYDEFGRATPNLRGRLGDN